MICPLCGERRARRGCPALSKQICAICCGTKRLVEIQCPAECPYLAVAREHPPAPAVRQQQRDFGLVVPFMRDLNDRQGQLFILITRFLLRYEPPELQPLIDEDVADAAGSMAATLETSVRGVIYEHRSASLSAERLVTALKPVLAEAGQHGGTTFERDAAVVFRRVEEAARAVRSADSGNRRAFLELLGRVMRKTESESGGAVEQHPEPSRLIVP